MADGCDATAVETVRAAIDADADTIAAQLAELCAFPSVYGDPEHAEDLSAAADWVAEQLASLGLKPERITTSDGSDTLVATREGTDGAPRVLLYSHYDVVPVSNPEDWTADPFTLTERDGRFYARGAADCKGNVVAHLAALRAVASYGAGSEYRPALTVVVEGSEESGGPGLDDLIERRPELFAADAILIADSGNIALGTPTLTTCLRGGAQVDVTVSTLHSAVHSGLMGGAAPDAVFALLHTLDSLRDDAGRTVIDGVDTTGRWDGAPYDVTAFREDAAMLPGTQVMGTEEDNPADLLWARPAVTVTGFDSTPIAQAINAVPPTASARLNLRVPAGMSARPTAEALAEHLKAHTPWGARCEVEISDLNEPFATDDSLPAARTLSACLAAAYGKEETVAAGSGGSIPLTAALEKAHPNAEIALFGVEEPLCGIHSVDESVSLDEIRAVAAAEALFLLHYGKNHA